ncbi:MAG: hypothetical protein ACJAUV_002021 [Flavobacteriales bacterium]|jgi:hypothetical protein
MTVEQRKTALINLITSTNNESLLIRMEELIQNANTDIPESIKRLLTLSAESENIKEYSSVREILK